MVLKDAVQLTEERAQFTAERQESAAPRGAAGEGRAAHGGARALHGGAAEAKGGEPSPAAPRLWVWFVQKHVAGDIEAAARLGPLSLSFFPLNLRLATDTNFLRIEWWGLRLSIEARGAKGDCV